MRARRGGTDATMSKRVGDRARRSTRRALGALAFVVAVGGCRHDFSFLGDAETSCADQNLGSAVGARVASGTTANMGNDSRPSCGTSNATEVSFAWTAPVDAAYQIDTRGSTFDTILQVENGACGGSVLMCNDDGGGGTTSSVQVALAAGQTVLITVDGYQSNSGTFVLNITPMP
jgi:hypothetical protein